MHLEYTITELPAIATKILETSKSKNILFFGEMGSGKTTLIKEIVKQLGVHDTVSSPTFSIVNEYVSDDNQTVFHFDFYRIENEQEAFEIGLDEYFEKNAWCLTEWPENVKNLLPLNRTEIHITILDMDTRKLIIK